MNRLPRLRGRGAASLLHGSRCARPRTRREPSSRPTDGASWSAIQLERELKETVKHRATQRKSLEEIRYRPDIGSSGTPTPKSTFLNAVTDADVLVEDRLFAPPDSTMRRLELPDQQTVLLADTVGFVRRLPHHLVEAFWVALSEVAEADLLLHVVGGTDPDPAGQIAAVREVLLEIGAAEIPELENL